VVGSIREESWDSALWRMEVRAAKVERKREMETSWRFIGAMVAKLVREGLSVVLGTSLGQGQACVLMLLLMMGRGGYERIYILRYMY